MPTNPSETARNSRRLAPLLLAALFACALAPCVWEAAAQSGRRKTDPARRSPVPTPTPADPAPVAESESQPRGGTKNTSIVATFVVYEDENLELDFSITGSQRDIVSRSFFERLRQSPSIEVTSGGKGTRGQTRERAKKERTAYAVHLQLEEDTITSASDRRRTDTLGRNEPSMYALRVSVYAPVSGDLKYSDLVHQRAYRPTARVGGIPVPVPVGRERIPGEYQLAQVARDAADRLLSRFDITRPPDN